MLNIEKLDKRAVRDVAAQMGWDGQEAQPREEVPQVYLDKIALLSADEFTEKFLHWNGILNWSSTITSVVLTTLTAVELEPEVRDPNIVEWFKKVLDIDVSDLLLEELDYPIIEIEAVGVGLVLYIKFMSYGGKLDAELGKRFMERVFKEYQVNTLIELERWRAMRVYNSDLAEKIAAVTENS